MLLYSIASQKRLFSSGHILRIWKNSNKGIPGVSQREFHSLYDHRVPNRSVQHILSGSHKKFSPSFQNLITKRTNFSFAGPKKLDEILKLDMIKGKDKTEVSDIWMTYHENKENVFGSILSAKDGEEVLKRAHQCPFFIQPIFRGEGYFNLVCEFQKPSHFFLAYLEDYQMDPSRAQPLITFSIFPDLSDKLGINLVRCDIINKGIGDIEGFKAVESILNMYKNDKEFERIRIFNEEPQSFDFDDYVAIQNQRWKDEK